MLFDPRGKRRRVIQVTYVFMALLFVVSLVGFGIGSGTHGGLFGALAGSADGHGGSVAQEQLAHRYEDLTEANPASKRAWLELARAESNVGLADGNIDRAAGQLSDRGREILFRAARAWKHYLTLKPRRPDPGVAAIMVRVYIASSNAIDALPAQEIVHRASPSASSAYQLAILAYAAGQGRRGESVGRQALRLTPQAQRSNVRALLRQAQLTGPRPIGLPSAPTHGGGHGATR